MHHNIGNKRIHTHTYILIYTYIDRVGEFDMRKTTWVSKVQHKVQGMYSNHYGHVEENMETGSIQGFVGIACGMRSEHVM